MTTLWMRTIQTRSSRYVTLLLRCSCSPILILHAKYINGTLKVKFDLDTTSKSKPVAGPDDLLLLLVQHWARENTSFPPRTTDTTSPRSCCSNPTRAVDPPSSSIPRRAKPAKTLLGKQKRLTSIDNLEREEIRMTTNANADGGLEYDDDLLFDSDDDDTDDCYPIEVDGLDGQCGRTAMRASSASLGWRYGSAKRSVTRTSASGSSRTRSRGSETSWRWRFTCGTIRRFPISFLD